MNLNSSVTPVSVGCIEVSSGLENGVDANFLAACRNVSQIKCICT